MSVLAGGRLVACPLRTDRAQCSGLLRGAPRPCRPQARARSLLEDPHRTLGVSSGADEREIKAAYRRLARKYHPDVCPTQDAERRFVSIQQAYEILTGKSERRCSARGAATTNQVNNWEFHDWFWSFTASRRWAAQHGPKPPADAGRAPQPRPVLNTQLAGLRQRAAIRHTKAARGAAAAAPADEQARDEPGRAGPHSYQQQQQPGAPVPGAGHAPPPQRGQAPPPPPLEYDTTSMADGVNVASGEGYDPWAPDAAAARARRPAGPATDGARRHLAGQLGGLKRRAAVKRRADGSGGGGGDGGSGGQAGGGGAAAAAAGAGGSAEWVAAAAHTCVEDDPWAV